MSYRLVVIEDRDIPMIREKLGHRHAPVVAREIWQRIEQSWNKGVVTLDQVEHLMSKDCQNGDHDWDICSVWFDSHPKRTRRCLRCLDMGLGVFQDQAISAYGRYRKSWRGEWGPIEIRMILPTLLQPMRAIDPDFKGE